MSAWGKYDDFSSPGTISIDGDGALTGSGTSFTDLHTGDFIKAVDGSSYILIQIFDDTSGTVINADPELGDIVQQEGTNYTVSEKPTSIASDPNTLASEVFGVDQYEIHGDGLGGYVSAVALVQGGSGYVEIPGVSFSGGGGSGAAASATIVGGVVTVVTVSNNGSSYETAPTVTIQRPVLTVPTTGVNTTSETITYNGHGQTTGAALTYNNGGGSSIGGLTSGSTYYARVADANSFTLYDTAAHATAGGATGLMNLSSTGNNAQYFIIDAGVRATANAALGVNQGSGDAIGGVAHTGWVKRKVLTGQHAGRIQYEVLVAQSKNAGIVSDAADDIEFPED